MALRPWLKGAVAGAVTIALATGFGAAAAPGSAAPETAAPTPSPASAPALTSTPTAGAEQITLITGDVVSYAPGAKSAAPQVSVTAAPRPDGLGVSFTEVQQGDSYFVFPSDARGLIGSGRLDRNLFDVKYLAENDFEDSATKQLPLIVQYGASVAKPAALANKADALPGTQAPQPLEVVHSAAVDVAKGRTSAFWASVAPESSLDRGIKKIWLDARAHALLDVSVPQIGAPAAWAAGFDGSGVKVAVLDTGIDADHPDLADKVVASHSFIGDDSIADNHGHGTHVASTIVGSGAASNGRYKGVAPGAELMVGKVLDDQGYGSNSWIIEGMQWAAESGAKVVSISIGGSYTDGTDPMSQAVNELSEEYGTLFVIAAGNSGAGGVQTIETPGIAADALTVAAVDRNDAMASFSSRGPGRGAYALKPDIAAPGVNIVAARSHTSSLPDDLGAYVAMSGTSMATPHVAGSAALLAQEHPDWTGEKLKRVLMSSSKDVGAGAYSQGAGRVDVARAIGQQVYSTGSADFGLIAYPQIEPVTREVEYVNDGAQPVTLDLTTHLVSTKPVPADALSVSPSSITIPANGRASATVTLDAREGDLTTYAGTLTATGTLANGNDVVVDTAVGGFREPKRVQVTASVINPPPGATDLRYGGFLAQRIDDQPEFPTLSLSEPVQSHTGQLVAGHYTVGTDVTWRDADGEVNHAMVAMPDVDATEDTSVTFDLRKAEPVTFKTPKPGVPFQAVLGYRAVTENSKQALLQYFDQPYGETRLWTLPSPTASRGEFQSFQQALIGVDPITMQIRGSDRTRLTLTPHYQGVNAEFPKFDGRQTRTVVFGGSGTPADLASVGAKDRLVLLDLSDICPGDRLGNEFPCDSDGLDRIENAQRAGAIGVLAYGGGVGRSFASPTNSWGTGLWWPSYPIPTMNLPAAQGRALARLTRGPVRVDIDATATSPYLYPLAFAEDGRMSGGRHRVADRDLMRVENRIHADASGTASLVFAPILAGPRGLQPNWITVSGPTEVTAYLGPRRDAMVWAQEDRFTYESGYQAWSQSYTDRVVGGKTITRDLGEQPLVSGAARTDPAIADYQWQMCQSCRDGDHFNIQHPITSDIGGGGPVAWMRDADGRLTTDMHLYRDDGTEIPVREGLWFWFLFGYFSPYAVLPAEPTHLRLTEDVKTPKVDQVYARDVDSTWTFTSQRRDDGLTTVPPPGVGNWCSGWFVHTPTDDPNDEDGWDDPKLDPCQPSGELFLDYDFDLGLDNTVRAGKQLSIRVEGYHSQYLVPEPKTTQTNLWLSFDDGSTWQQVKLDRAKDGSFQGTYKLPKLGQTTGAVSVRAEATDSAGSTVKQTIDRAFGLTG